MNVLHWRGAGLSPPAVLPDATSTSAEASAFQIDTCQRRVAVLLGTQALDATRQRFPADGALEHFQGTAAYAFLLRCCCGLESKLVAETEIFGQIKQAWRAFSGLDGPLAARLAPWMQQLFQDAKEIRAQYLANLGGVSYGSQVRRLLGEAAAAGPTLLVGAGQLAQSVGPWLTGSELWIWNRTQARAQELALELSKRSPHCPVRVVAAGEAAELAAWQQAAQVIVCVPPEPVQDAARVAAWSRRDIQGGRVIHLGAGAEGVAPWNGLPEFVSLGTLFERLQAHSDLRRRQIERARGACQEKALLRSLGANASHSHSWEDLTAFSLV